MEIFIRTMPMMMLMMLMMMMMMMTGTALIVNELLLNTCNMPGAMKYDLKNKHSFHPHLIHEKNGCLD